MRIALVSTFKTECGIATYTEALTKALVAHGENIVVLAEAAPGTQGPPTKDDIPYYRTWNRGSFTVAPFVESIITSKNKPDVVHFQHEFGLFPNDGLFIQAVDQLVASGIKVVITLHTIFERPIKTNFYRRLRKARLIAHTSSSALQLDAHAVGLRTKYIPHGITWRPSKRSGNFKFLVPGFISPAKGHREIVEAFAEASVLMPDLKMKIIGLCREPLYLQEIDGYVRYFGLTDNVIIIPKYVSDDELVEEIADCHAVILGNGQKKGPYPHSASGQVALALGLNKLIIAKNVPIYNNLPVFLYNDDKELANLIIGSCSWGAPSEELQLIAQSRTWEHVAKQHVELYYEL